MTGNELPAVSIADLQSLLRRREVSPREVINALRQRVESIDPDVGAYLSLNFDAAVKEAEHANVDLPLGGIPIAIKDIIETADMPTGMNSPLFRGWRSKKDAPMT